MMYHSFEKLNGFETCRPFVSESSHYLVNYILIQSDGVQHIKKFTPCCLRDKKPYGRHWLIQEYLRQGLWPIPG